MSAAMTEDEARRKLIDAALILNDEIGRAHV